MLLKINGEKMSVFGFSMMLFKINELAYSFHYVYENKGGFLGDAQQGKL
jgi:hypothetical protein